MICIRQNRPCIPCCGPDWYSGRKQPNGISKMGAGVAKQRVTGDSCHPQVSEVAGSQKALPRAQDPAEMGRSRVQGGSDLKALLATMGGRSEVLAVLSNLRMCSAGMLQGSRMCTGGGAHEMHFLCMSNLHLTYR